MNIVRAATAEDMAAVRRLRYDVFVIEQKVPPEEEWDDLDASATHLLARDGASAVGTLRWRALDDCAKIERVCVARAARGTGLGAALMHAALSEIRAHPKLTRVRLGAQLQALGFYDALGFTAFGDVYEDAGIPHRMMELTL